MGRTPRPLPAELRGRPFRAGHAIDEGVTAGRLRARDLTAPIRGVRMPSTGDSVEQRCRAFLVHRSRDVAFSHVTAAVLLGAPLPRSALADSRIHVSVPGGTRAPQVAAVIGHTLSRWRVVTVRGWPLTEPAQLWLDLSSILDVPSLVALGDWLVSPRHPYATLEDLSSRLAEAAGRRGVTVARHALDLIRVGAESPAESRLRLLLTQRGLPEPCLNYRILDGNGGFIARVDLAYLVPRIAIEYEGDGHRVDRRVWFRDIRRRERVEDLGWRMVRVTADDLIRPEELLSRLRSLLSTARGER